MVGGLCPDGQEFLFFAAGGLRGASYTEILRVGIAAIEELICSLVASYVIFYVFVDGVFPTLLSKLLLGGWQPGSEA
jgi:hypothetical protein